MPFTIVTSTSFPDAGGSNFNTRATLTNEDVDGSDAVYGDVEQSLHFTAPVGTTYETILTVNTSDTDDEFGELQDEAFFWVINRSSTQSLTLRFNGASGTHAYVTIPAGKWFQVIAPILTVFRTDLSGSEAWNGVLDAKFASSTDRVEVWGFSKTSES